MSEIHLFASGRVRKVREWSRRRRARWARYRKLAAIIGPCAAIAYIRLTRARKEGRALAKLRPRGVAFPLLARPGSSDVRVFEQVFITLEYACLHKLQDVELIVDLGANVGYSSAYFLNWFRHASVIAVEPDAESFALLERNLRRYGGRVKTFRAGAWSHPARLSIRETPYRDGGAWTRQVQECGPNDASDLQGIDVSTLLKRSGHERISLLKVDIEGAEAVVFGRNYESWIDKVEAIAIELHDDSVFGNASDAFFAAIGGLGFQVSRCGELTICRKMR
jgi:FkbM family methyltransferase